MGWMVLRLLLCCTATIAVVVHGRFVGWVTYVGGWWMGRWVDCICLPKAPGQEMGKVMSFLRTKLSLTSTPCTNQIRAMSCNTTCKVDMISQQQRRYCCWADREQTQSVLRTRSYYHTTLQRCCRPAAAGGNTMRVKAAYPRCIGAYNPSPRKRHSWGCGRVHVPRSHRTITNCHENKRKRILCRVFFS